MFENKFVLLLITLIWMSGLSAVVLALAYMAQDRRRQRQNSGYSWSIPRFLVPLYASLATFCFGLALHAYAAQQPVSLWITIVWALLTISFVARMLNSLFSGMQDGWETRLNSRLFNMDSTSYGEQRSRIPAWGSMVVALLLVNLFFLSWWGSRQINAGTFAQQRSESVQIESAPTPPTVDAFAGGLATQALATNTVSVVVVEVTATATVEPSKEEPPSLPTTELAANVTVTPTADVITVAVPLDTPLPQLQLPQPSITVQNAKGANVRRAPSLQGEIITVLNDSTVAPVEGRTGDNQWFLIRLPDGQTGWISVQVAKPNEAVESSPIMAMN